MTEISTNNVVQTPKTAVTSTPQQYPNGYQPAPMIQKTIRDEFVVQHRKNGLVERLFNVLKNISGIGIGSKKVQAVVEKAEKGEITEDEARVIINKYRKSQANSAQVVGDGLSMAGGIASFLTTTQLIAKDGAGAYLRKAHGIIKKKPEQKTDTILDLFNRKNRGLRLSESQLAEIFKNPKSLNWKFALAGFLGAGFTKMFFGMIDRIGAKEFYTDKKDFNGAVNPYDKAAYSQARKQDKREKRSANWKNFLSGMINGATIPLMGIMGGIVGVPLYFVINSLNRYFVGNHVEEDKSFDNYMKNIKENGLLGATLALGVGIPVAIKTHKIAVFDNMSRKAVKLLENTKFADNEFNGKSTYDEISEILLRDSEIAGIIRKDKSMGRSWGEKVLTESELQDLAQELNDKNFFAAKFKQISNDGSALARVLKEDCRPTRTYEEAQAYVDRAFGKGVYTIDKEHYCLGVGTVAETYFAKGKDGDVCIKVIKEGMNADKIAKDKEAFLDIIDKIAINPETGKAYTQAEKNIFKQNVNNLADGVLKEIDLANEFKAAQELTKHTEYANVVKGIEVSKDNNAYVMERAKGISLESLMNLNEAYSYRENMQKLLNGDIKSVGGFMEGVNAALGEAMVEANMRGGSPLKAIVEDWNLTTKEKLQKINEFIDKIERKTPTHGNIKLAPEDLKNLITEYQQVLVEQYNKINAGGKVIHGDIHPGNIFIDVDALKNMKAPSKAEQILTDLTGRVNRKNHGVFTLIDTGNVIELSKEQSISLLNLTSYIEHGNYKKIAEYVMQGVEGDALGGHTKEEATKIIEEQLKKSFTDTTTPLDIMTTDNLLKLTSNIMKKHNIVPNDTQLNLNKAIQSANNSYDALVKGIFDSNLGNGQALGMLFGYGEGAKSGSFLKQLKKNMEKTQEKENLRNMSLTEKRHQKKLDGNLNPNQVEYHIYRLKQGLAEKPEINPRPNRNFGLSDDKPLLDDEFGELI